MIFRKHYTRDEARALLPRVREWLDRLAQSRAQYARREAELTQSRGMGDDLGGEAVHDWVRHLVEMREVLMEFHDREIQVKDLDRGLIDFPAIKDGREVFLCWEKGEGDVEFWHELDAGYAGREPLEES